MKIISQILKTIIGIFSKIIIALLIGFATSMGKKIIEPENKHPKTIGTNK